MEELPVAAQQALGKQSVSHGRKRCGRKAERLKALLDCCRWEAFIGVPAPIHRGAQERMLYNITTVKGSFNRSIHPRYPVCRY
jgi:hypothetical protein